MVNATFKQLPQDKIKSPGERYQVTFEPGLFTNRGMITKTAGPDLIGLARRVIQVLDDCRPEALTLSVYVDGNLSPEDRGRIRQVIGDYKGKVKVEYSSSV